MEAIHLYNLGVPCKSTIEPQDEEVYHEDKLFSLSPDTIFRREPHGATLVAPSLFSPFIYIDEEMAKLMAKERFSLRGARLSAVSLLREHRIITESRKKKKAQKSRAPIGGLPIQCLLDITSACNCDCITCYHASDLDSFFPSLKKIKQRIRRLKKLGVRVVEVTGGEPFLRGDLAEILHYIHRLKLRFYIVTNGEFLSKMDKTLAGEIKKGMGLAISLDGVGQTHDRVRRRPGLYQRILKGLGVCRDNGIRFFLISTLNRHNVHCVEGMISLAEQHNTFVHLRPTVRTGNAANNELGSIDLRQIVGKKLTSPHARNGFIGARRVIPRSRYYGCGTRSRISVDVRGRIYPCVMDRSAGLKKIEDYSARVLFSDLNGQAASLLHNHAQCRQCEYFLKNPNEPLCGGFCRFSKSYQQEIK